MIYRLDNNLWFPDPRRGDDDGLFAIGGDLSVDRLLLAYSNGIFPWYSFRDYDEIQWWCPMDRYVILPHEIHISHSMRSLLNKDIYHVTFNRDFQAVIDNCSELRIEEKGAWLGPQMIAAFSELHRQGFAASVEVWDEDEQLVGGLYGVCLGRCFMGESMFSLAPSASKVALIALAQLMEKNGGLMIDCQFETPHLRSMGGRHISYDDYLAMLRQE